LGTRGACSARPAKLANATIAVKQYCCRIMPNFEAFLRWRGTASVEKMRLRAILYIGWRTAACDFNFVDQRHCGAGAHPSLRG
jgi:hypothetical protein